MEKLAPKEAVMHYCRECVQGLNRPELVKNCEGDKALNGPCPFFEYRLGEKRASVRVFCKFCLDRMCGSEQAVKECTTESCQCFPYRFGKNPALAGKRKVNEKSMEAFRKYRESVRSMENISQI